MLPAMNSHRHTKPPFPAQASSRAGSLSTFLCERADLSGLEVRDSTWDEWVEVQMQVQAARAKAVGTAAPQATTRKGSVQ
jgi:hypothetical protein